MDELIIALPDHYKTVVDRLVRADWVVHNFMTQNRKDIYNPAKYLFNSEFNNLDYHALIDLNILQYIVNCVKKKSKKSQYRDACSLLLFCRIADINIEPSLAIYERINYNAENLEEALNDLALLRALDNADTELLANYVLTDFNSLKAIKPFEIDRETIGKQLTQYQRLTNWNSIYLLVLGAVSIYWNTSISNNKKLEYYLDWMIQKFRLSLPCIVYAVRMFGHNPLPKMMKYKIDSDEYSKRTAIFNMTWDLFHIDHYFKNWIDPEKKWEELFFTQDNMLRSLFRLAIEAQLKGDISPIVCYLTQPQASKCRKLIDGCNYRNDRVYRTCEWSYEYRENLILEFENTLYNQ